jgi:hypothetical protein
LTQEKIMKNIVSATFICGLTLFNFMPLALAKTHTNLLPNRSNQHSEARPSSSHSQNATHHLDYQVRQDNLTEIIIQFPEGVRIGGIEIKDHASGEIIPAEVKTDKKMAFVKFNEKIAPATPLEINIKQVNTPGYAATWSYALFGKVAGLDREIPLGNLSVRTYD